MLLVLCPHSPCAARDAFIASTGCIPGENRTLQENALSLARMALEMQKLCATLRAPDGSPVLMRIGLHCGPVVGGIVGGNMIRYHLFGSTLDAVTQVGGRGKDPRVHVWLCLDAYPPRICNRMPPRPNPPIDLLSFPPSLQNPTPSWNKPATPEMRCARNSLRWPYGPTVRVLFLF